MINPVNAIFEILEFVPNNRAKEVVARRFGLADGRRHTLEAIGQDHGITRERVRQIEENSLASLRQPEALKKIQPFFDLTKQHLEEHGGLKREQKLFEDLTYVCFPAKEIKKQLAGSGEELTKCQAAFNLILTLGESFERLPESDFFHAVWVTSGDALKNAKKTVDSLVSYLNDKKSVLAVEDLIKAVKKEIPHLPEQAIQSYVDASRHIDKNHLGFFGLISWPEISPRGVKDRAYIIFKKENKPLHFSEVTRLINEVLPSDKQAYIQTVHNELIKDSRFVLVGRGLYALTEWGYQPGTVAEIIQEVLKELGPLNREEIVKKVLVKRLVKENTVLINLQNRKLFSRDGQNRYILAA
jgi:hypothetical protein